jgi:hypothetical protein
MDDPAFDPARDHVLGAWIRDPARTPPQGVAPRRLKVYADLFYRNVEGLLASAFPVLRQTLGEEAWHALVRDFLREHPARTPLFTELAREALGYFEARAGQQRGDPPWLCELAHYEWVELALQVSEAVPPASLPDAALDPLASQPWLSPLAWPLAYAWPVHRIGPGAIPAAPAAPALLLVRRVADGSVAFTELSPLAFRLLQRIEQQPDRSGRDHLVSLGEEAGAADTTRFVADGARLLATLFADGTLFVTPGAG